jgi:adenine-specific DNA-methyltransferase
MQEREIKNILTNDYAFDKWQRLIDFVFPKVRFEDKIISLDDSNSKTKYIHQKGDITLTDKRKIIILEVCINKDYKISKTKVGFHNITSKYIDQNNNHGVLVFYISEDETQHDYRLSFICKQSHIDENNGMLKDFKTNPKRYTYLLGINESATTAAKRLRELASKKNTFNFELKDVIDAFSVEKLNDEFFKKYKEQFQIFNNHLIEDDKIRYSIFDIDKNEKEEDKTANELPIRDFTKKLLGRLVFLYFLQRKGWMGVPTPTGSQKVTWKIGYKNFVYKLFTEAAKPEKFHSKYLSELFYNTLNNESRENFVFLIDGKSPFKDAKNVSVPYLNGGLFDDDFPKGNKIDFPKHIFENLFEFLEQYNFTIDENSPEDHEVGIDPEMLGHIFENLLEDNRDKGAYYTPKEVVHYMSQQSIIEYLKHNLNTDSKDIDDFVKGNVVSDFVRANHSLIKKLLKEVKVCDPAIGSGAFPMGVLKVIFTALQNLHNAISPNESFNEAKVKKDIIQKSIYGVDLEKGAVDIARLRFWLALVVDEDKPQPLPNLDYKIMQGNSILEKFEDVDLSNLLKDENEEIITAHKGQVELPGFGRNQSVFVFDSTTKEEFQSLIDLYFDFKVDASHPYKTKQEVKAKINSIIEGKLKAKFALDKTKLQATLAEKQSHVKANAINAHAPKGVQDKKTKAAEKLNKEIESLEYKIAHLSDILDRLNRWEHEEKERPYFLWHTYFKDVFDKGKFDIIIGNPPYIKEYTNRKAFDGIRESPYYMGKMDIWYFFACFCIDILKDNGGIQCFIAQNNWITSSGAAKLRNKIVQETEMLSFIDFGNYKVFQSAGIQTMIYVVKRTTPREKYTTNYARLLVDNIDKTFLDYFLQSDATTTHENYERLNFEFVPASYADGYITFANDTNDYILKKIQGIQHTKLLEKEVAQGIVFPQDFLNKKSAEKLGEGFKVGNGVFALNTTELQSLQLSKNEEAIIKPYFTTEQFKRFYAKNEHDYWLIYTDSSFKKQETINHYPNIKRHLDKFAKVITSDNYPYGLHRAREERFFKNEKIIVQRKCPGRPIFTYANFDTYVSATFFLIQTERANLKYLTALLNSKLVAFWLRSKGKMQGNNYQIDKEPLLEIPIALSDKQHIIATLVDYILLVHQPRKEQLIKYIGDDLIIHSFDEVIDQAFYEIYFGAEPEMAELQVLKYLENIKPISEDYTDADIETVVKFYHWLHEQTNPVRTALLKANIVSKDIIGVINSTIS